MNEDEEGFLNKIAENRADLAPRLVYADWLEERGDSRSDLIRIEEEMRQLPVFSDRFWELKPQRNQLRSRAPAGWLEAMNYTRHSQLIFAHGIPDGWKERWRLIREFTERWHNIPTGDVGGRQTEIAETEARLGRTLPPSLREYVAFAYDVRRRPNYHDVFRDVYRMQDIGGHPALSLLLQGEGDYHWAVRHADMDAVDPPVYGYHWNEEEVFISQSEQPIYDNITEFVQVYALSYTHGEVGGFHVDINTPTNILENLLTFFQVHTRINRNRTTIFEDENFLIQFAPIEQYALVRLWVELCKPLQREEMPAFLLEHTRNGGSFHGIFAPSRRRNDIPF